MRTRAWHWVLLAALVLGTAQAFLPKLQPVRANPLVVRQLDIQRKNAPQWSQTNRRTISAVSPSVGATSSAQSSPPAVQQTGKHGGAETAKIGALFGLWYALNIGYNIYNKRVLNAVPQLTYSVAFLQLVIGLVYLLPVWIFRVRPYPRLSADDLQKLLPIAVLHTLTHLGAVVSLGAGAVSFTHIVKAAEPAVSAAISAVFANSFLPLPVYLSLLPVMGGVAIASATELSFSWLSFGAAMISNVASAARAIVGKKALAKPIGQHMDAANTYGIMNILAALMVLPIALILEGGRIVPTLRNVLAAGKGQALLVEMIMSGLFYYLYNEVAFLALDNVAPVTHAIGNTIKRVVIIVSSVLVFGTRMSTQGMVGSTIAILGVLLYSLCKNHFK